MMHMAHNTLLILIAGTDKRTFWMREDMYKNAKVPSRKLFFILEYTLPNFLETSFRYPHFFLAANLKFCHN
jgi:hypothetical protein